MSNITYSDCNDNITYGSLTMGNDQFNTSNEDNDYMYDAELRLCNETHYCLEVIQGIEVRVA